MKSPVYTRIFLILALAGVASADLPKTAPAGWAAGLVDNSPFTSKPARPTPNPGPNPLDRYGLVGVSPIGNSDFRVTLIHKDRPADRIIIDSDKPDGGFKILDISRKAGDPLGTVVNLQLDTQTGTVGFDRKLIVIAGKATPAPSGRPPAAGPGPRPRVIPPSQ